MAENAINHVDGMNLNDRRVYVGFHVSKRERDGKLEEIKNNFTNVFVKNVDASVTEKEFDALFQVYGPTTSISLAMDEEGTRN